MPYTTNKRYSVQASATNSGVWGAGGSTGDDLNTGVMSLLDTQLAEVVTNSLSSSNVTLSYANVQSCMLRFTGTLLANITVSPDTGGSPVASTYFRGFYFFENLTSGSFSVTISLPTVGTVALPQGRRGVLFVDGTNGPRIVAIVGSSTADPIPAGSKTLWYNTSAPSGWSAVALNDYAIKIVTNGGGGVTSGTVPYSTLYATTSVGSHALTISEMPLHGHPALLSTANDDGSGSGGLLLCNTTTTSAAAYTGTPSSTVGQQIGGSGGGDGHTHDLDMRVTTAAFVLASRD